MKILFTGEGKVINMHLLGLSVREAIELNKRYNNKFSEFGEYSFKDCVSEAKQECRSLENEGVECKESHNLDNYLSWRGSLLNGMGRINYK